MITLLVTGLVYVHVDVFKRRSVVMSNIIDCTTVGADRHVRLQECRAVVVSDNRTVVLVVHMYKCGFRNVGVSHSRIVVQADLIVTCWFRKVGV